MAESPTVRPGGARGFVGVLISLAIALVWSNGSWADDYPNNEQPMYGGMAKTPEMIAADKAFINQVQSMGYTRAQGSDKSVALGWREIFQTHNLAVAMKRFNQAWLLDPDNGDAYHGMAVVVLDRDRDVASAERLFKRALAAPRKGPNVDIDFGRFLLMQGRPKEALPVLERATRTPGSSPDGQALLALAFLDAGDIARACAEARKATPSLQPPLKAQIDQITSDARCR